MTPSSDIDPLGPDERELARILRALPAAEPPAALDAKILRAAADASASRDGRRVGWLGAGGALWGIGSAAAAVLALGIGWQALYGGHQPAEPMSKPISVEDSAESDSVSVEFKDHSSLADDVRNAPAAPPPAPMAAPATALQQAPGAARNAVAQAPAAASPAAVAAPAPAPFPDASLDEHVAARAEPVAADAAASGQLAAAKATDGTTATGGAAAAQREGQATPPLRPATWLGEIRTLRDQGKITDARARLLEFRRQYPHWIIPTDLAPLLRE